MSQNIECFYFLITLLFFILDPDLDILSLTSVVKVFPVIEY